MEVPYANVYLNYGVLGVTCIILMIVSYSLFKLLLLEKDKRRDDVEKFNIGLLEPIKQLGETSKIQITLQQQILEMLLVN